jgi:hypothetical protein
VVVRRMITEWSGSPGFARIVAPSNGAVRATTPTVD